MSDILDKTMDTVSETAALRERVAVVTHIQAMMGAERAAHGAASDGIVEALGVLAVEVLAGVHVAD